MIVINMILSSKLLQSLTFEDKNFLKQITYQYKIFITINQ
jgi:hypothetical protein